MKQNRNGVLSPHIGEWHIRKHEAAITRAYAMAEMSAVGLSDAEIARRFKTSENAVKATLKRHGFR